MLGECTKHLDLKLNMVTLIQLKSHLVTFSTLLGSRIVILSAKMETSDFGQNHQKSKGVSHGKLLGWFHCVLESFPNQVYASEYLKVFKEYRVNLEPNNLDVGKCTEFLDLNLKNCHFNSTVWSHFQMGKRKRFFWHAQTWQLKKKSWFSPGLSRTGFKSFSHCILHAWILMVPLSAFLFAHVSLQWAKNRSGAGSTHSELFSQEIFLLTHLPFKSRLSKSSLPGARRNIARFPALLPNLEKEHFQCFIFQGVQWQQPTKSGCAERISDQYEGWDPQLGVQGLTQRRPRKKPGVSVEFCKGARQSGLVSVWQHTLVGQWLQGFL